MSYILYDNKKIKISIPSPTRISHARRPSSQKTVRLNARIDADLADKIAFLSRSTHKTTTDVIRDSVLLMYEQTQMTGAQLFKQMQEVGFIGGLKGAEPSLSEDYKKIFSERVMSKLWLLSIRDFGAYRFKNTKPFRNLLVWLA